LVAKEPRDMYDKDSLLTKGSESKGSRAHHILVGISVTGARSFVGKRVAVENRGGWWVEN